MKTSILVTLILTLAGMLIGQAASAEDVVKVTADNYVRAETDYRSRRMSRASAALGNSSTAGSPTMSKTRSPSEPIGTRSNSFGVFDLTSLVTVTLPDPKGRYQSLMSISQDHSITAYYSPRTVTLTREMVGTRYVFLAIRTFLDPNDEADVQAAHKLQDQVVVKQANVGKYEVPNWDKEGIETLRTAINVRLRKV